MKKILLLIILITIAGTQSCQKKASNTAIDTTANNTPSPATNYTPNYKAPPSNRVADAIAWTTAALNNRDSAGFWNSFTWENRDRDGFPELFRETQTLWDSTKGSRIEVMVVSTNVFARSVHETTDTALFANAVVNIRISGEKTVRFDSMVAILRVENGKWLLGSFSFDDPNKPFRVSSEK